MISLIGYTFYHRKIDLRSIDKLFLCALVAALLGDIFLLRDDLFVWGLLSFLCMQILYILTFIKGKNYYGLREGVFGIGLIVFNFLILRWLWPLLNDMAIPVLVYSCAISIMSWFAWTRDKLSAGYWLIWVGTLLFIISDMTIAIHKFTEVRLGSLTIMATYSIAQLLIVLGYLSFRRE